MVDVLHLCLDSRKTQFAHCSCLRLLACIVSRKKQLRPSKFDGNLDDLGTGKNPY